MHPPLAALAEIYKTNTGLLLLALSDVTEEHIIKRPTNTTNSMLFIAGHLATTRFKICGMAGLSVECPWGEIFARGAVLKDASEYPSIAEIKENWTSVTDKMIGRFSEITEQELKAKAPFDFPVEDNTILGGIAFLALHDSYHIGQLAYIRRLLSYSQLAG